MPAQSAHLRLTSSAPEPRRSFRKTTGRRCRPHGRRHRGCKRNIIGLSASTQLQYLDSPITGPNSYVYILPGGPNASSPVVNNTFDNGISGLNWGSSLPNLGSSYNNYGSNQSSWSNSAPSFGANPFAGNFEKNPFAGNFGEPILAAGGGTRTGLPPSPVRAVETSM